MQQPLTKRYFRLLEKLWLTTARATITPTTTSSHINSCLSASSAQLIIYAPTTQPRSREVSFLRIAFAPYERTGRSP